MLRNKILRNVRVFGTLGKKVIFSPNFEIFVEVEFLKNKKTGGIDGISLRL
uniref:Uncharacterized protein n=1 Tax=viral metagenome TaxID=1070528 RepID=A0A6M3JPB0_9ZZZZ